jgi:adenosylhomocysteine nucleosidase
MTEGRIAELVDRAFDYRGYVTLRRKDGSELVGFVYDRGASHLELLDETATRRTRVPLAEIAGIAFTGEDAARKSQEIWERRKGTLEPRETPAYGDWTESGPVLVLVALDSELRSVARALGRTPRRDAVRGQISGTAVVALACGMGGDPRRALAEERPRLVVSCGFGGALEAGLAAGDLVLATAVRGAGGDVLTAPESPRIAAARALHGLRCLQGELVSVTSVAATPEEKRALARPGALAVDMESHAVARAAQEAGIPWLALRVVVDPLDSELPPFTREARGGYLWPALRHALSGPRAAAGLVRLARDSRRAGAALELAIGRLARALPGAEARP